MIKFVLAALWICAATLGSVFYSFQLAGGPTEDDGTPQPPMMGGLDYVKTDVISVPMLRNAAVDGYFLARLVYTVDPAELRKLTVPVDAVITDVVYSFLYSSPVLDFRKGGTIDLEALRKGVRDGINERVEYDLVKDVLVEQVDYLSKEEIRDNALKRRQPKPVAPREQDGPLPKEPPSPAH